MRSSTEFPEPAFLLAGNTIVKAGEQTDTKFDVEALLNLFQKIAPQQGLGRVVVVAPTKSDIVRVKQLGDRLTKGARRTVIAVDREQCPDVEEWDRDTFNKLMKADGSVLVITPHLCLQALNKRRISLGDFDLVVFVKCHHCHGNDPCARILIEHYHRMEEEAKKKVRLLGFCSMYVAQSRKSQSAEEQVEYVWDKTWELTATFGITQSESNPWVLQPSSLRYLERHPELKEAERSLTDRACDTCNGCELAAVLVTCGPQGLEEGACGDLQCSVARRKVVGDLKPAESPPGQLLAALSYLASRSQQWAREAASRKAASHPCAAVVVASERVRDILNSLLQQWEKRGWIYAGGGRRLEVPQLPIRAWTGAEDPALQQQGPIVWILAAAQWPLPMSPDVVVHLRAPGFQVLPENIQKSGCNIVPHEEVKLPKDLEKYDNWIKKKIEDAKPDPSNSGGVIVIPDTQVRCAGLDAAPTLQRVSVSASRDSFTEKQYEGCEDENFEMQDPEKGRTHQHFLSKQYLPLHMPERRLVVSAITRRKEEARKLAALAILRRLHKTGYADNELELTKFLPTTATFGKHGVLPLANVKQGLSATDDGRAEVIQTESARVPLGGSHGAIVVGRSVVQFLRALLYFSRTSTVGEEALQGTMVREAFLDWNPARLARTGEAEGLVTRLLEHPEMTWMKKAVAQDTPEQRIIRVTKQFCAWAGEMLKADCGVGGIWDLMTFLGFGFPRTASAARSADVGIDGVLPNALNAAACHLLAQRGVATNEDDDIAELQEIEIEVGEASEPILVVYPKSGNSIHVYRRPQIAGPRIWQTTQLTVSATEDRVQLVHEVAEALAQTLVWRQLDWGVSGFNADPKPSQAAKEGCSSRMSDSTQSPSERGSDSADSLTAQSLEESEGGVPPRDCADRGGESKQGDCDAHGDDHDTAEFPAMVVSGAGEGDDAPSLYDGSEGEPDVDSVCESDYGVYNESLHDLEAFGGDDGPAEIQDCADSCQGSDRGGELQLDDRDSLGGDGGGKADTAEPEDSAGNKGGEATPVPLAVREWLGGYQLCSLFNTVPETPADTPAAGDDDPISFREDESALEVNWGGGLIRRYMRRAGLGIGTEEQEQEISSVEPPPGLALHLGSWRADHPKIDEFCSKDTPAATIAASLWTTTLYSFKRMTWVSPHSREPLHPWVRGYLLEHKSLLAQLPRPKTAGTRGRCSVAGTPTREWEVRQMQAPHVVEVDLNPLDKDSKRVRVKYELKPSGLGFLVMESQATVQPKAVTFLLRENREYVPTVAALADAPSCRELNERLWSLHAELCLGGAETKDQAQKLESLMQFRELTFSRPWIPVPNEVNCTFDKLLDTSELLAKLRVGSGTNKALFVEALTHNSYGNSAEARKNALTGSYGRLAFLGKHLLELVVAEAVRSKSEGQWSAEDQDSVAKALTSTVSCAWMAHELGLDALNRFRSSQHMASALELYRGFVEKLTPGFAGLCNEQTWPEAMECGVPLFLADMFHAVCAALFLNVGFDTCCHTLTSCFITGMVTHVASHKSAQWLDPERYANALAPGVVREELTPAGFTECCRAAGVARKAKGRTFCCDEAQEAYAKNTKCCEEFCKTGAVEWGKAQMKELREELEVVTHRPLKPPEEGPDPTPLFFVQQGAKDLLEQRDTCVVDVMVHGKDGEKVRVLRVASTAKDTAHYVAAWRCLANREELERKMAGEEVKVDEMTAQRRADVTARRTEILGQPAKPGPVPKAPGLPEPLKQIVTTPIKIEPIKCTTCNVWLNGQDQYDDHLQGKKHKKNEKNAAAGSSSKRDEPGFASRSQAIGGDNSDSSSDGGSSCSSSFGGSSTTSPRGVEGAEQPTDFEAERDVGGPPMSGGFFGGIDYAAEIPVTRSVSDYVPGPYAGRDALLSRGKTVSPALLEKLAQLGSGDLSKVEELVDGLLDKSSQQ